ncbi:MAG: hypothetical protein V4498_07405 [candidate division FCPU426 bacterium]
MKIYLRGNPRTYGGIALKTGLNQLDTGSITALAAVPEFRDAVKSGLVRLPDGAVLPMVSAPGADVAPTETAAQRKAREKAERDAAQAADNAAPADAPKTEDAPPA